MKAVKFYSFLITLSLVWLGCNKEEQYKEKIEGFWRSEVNLGAFPPYPSHTQLHFDGQYLTRYYSPDLCTFLDKHITRGPIEYSIEGNTIRIDYEDGVAIYYIEKLTRNKLQLKVSHQNWEEELNYKRCF